MGVLEKQQICFTIYHLHDKMEVFQNHRWWSWSGIKTLSIDSAATRHLSGFSPLSPKPWFAGAPKRSLHCIASANLYGSSGEGEGLFRWCIAVPSILSRLTPSSYTTENHCAPRTWRPTEIRINRANEADSLMHPLCAISQMLLYGTFTVTWEKTRPVHRCTLTLLGRDEFVLA